MQLLYSTQVVTVSKLVVEWAETKRVCICVLQLYEEEQVVVGWRCFLVDDYEVKTWMMLQISSQMNYGEHEAGVDNSYLDEMIQVVTEDTQYPS